MLRVACCSLLMTAIGCSSGTPASVRADAAKAPVGTAEPVAVQRPNQPPAPDLRNLKPAGSALKIDPNRAMQTVKKVFALGPRTFGAAGHSNFGALLREQSPGVKIEEDAFTADTPAGKFPATNYIAKFPGTKEGVIVLASHFDTPYPLRTTKFAGANDGASSSGLLVEIGRVLRERSKGKPLDGHSVWLVWLDAEEAVREWTEADSRYGSRRLADKWQQDGTLKSIKAFILMDMIGDKDLSVDRDSNSTPWLTALVYKAAANLGLQSYFHQRELGIEDDHIPFARKGVPVVDLIDFEYGYNNVFWHSADDTLDKVSAASLETVGNVVLESIRLLNGMEQEPAR